MSAPHIVVLGAGYTGVSAAKLLATRTGATVTVVNNRDRFVERMRNHQVACGRPPRHTPLSGLFARTGIRLVVGQVTRVDPGRRRVELAGGAEPIAYDLLVYALGSHADLDAVPGAAEHACAIATAEQAQRLHQRMSTAGTVAVVGAGPTGLETAAELAETYPGREVRLITGGTLGETLSEPGRAYLHRTAERLGIKVWEHTKVVEVGPDGPLLADGTRVAADAVAWTAGFAVSRLARAAGLAVDGSGRLLVDATLRSVSHPEVYGVGDAAAAHTGDGHALRMGCGPGGLTAACAFYAIRERLAGRSPKPLRAGFDALCIGLGRRDALLQPIDLDGNPRGRLRTGRPIAMVKSAVLIGAGRFGPRHPAFVVAGARQG